MEEERRAGGVILADLPPGSHEVRRQRKYSLSLTFQGFRIQVLSPGTSCREIVRRLQAWLAACNLVRIPLARSVRS